MANVRYPGTAGTTPGTITAADVTYDNTTSGLTADDVQEAIDEIEGQIGGLSYDASDISYDNTTSGLTADDVQEALDEIEGNVETKANSADVPLKTQISNPNLLDNPWFTVNQRGATSWVASEGNQYRFDRWIFDAGDGSYTNGVVTNTNAFYQMQEDARVVPLFGKTVTISWMLSDGTIGHETSTVPNSLTSEYVGIFRNPYVQALFHSGNLSQLARVSANVAVKAVKLEIGSISTLAMDTAPNYATELLKCQRYFVRYKQTNANAMEYGFMVASTTTSAHGIVNLPTSMRTTPSLVVADTTKLSLYGQYKYSLTALSIAICDDQNKVVKLLATASGMTAGTAYMLQADTGYGFDLSADL